MILVGIVGFALATRVWNAKPKGKKAAATDPPEHTKPRTTPARRPTPADRRPCMADHAARSVCPATRIDQQTSMCGGPDPISQSAVLNRPSPAGRWAGDRGRTFRHGAQWKIPVFQGFWWR